MRAKGGWWMSDVNDLCVLSESGLSFNLFQPSVHRFHFSHLFICFFWIGSPELRLQRNFPGDRGSSSQATPLPSVCQLQS